MMIWNTYGKWVKIAAGMSILGGLWYTTGPGVRGEDWAEARGALHERSVIPYLYGTNAPSARAAVTNIVETTNYMTTVTVSITAGAPYLTLDTPTTLVFTDADYATPQTVTAHGTTRAPWTQEASTITLTDDETPQSQTDVVFYSGTGSSSEVPNYSPDGNLFVSVTEMSRPFDYTGSFTVKLENQPATHPYVSGATTNITEVYDTLDTVNPGLVWSQTYPVLQGFRSLMQSGIWLEDSTAFAAAAEGYIFEAAHVEYVKEEDRAYPLEFNYYWVDGNADSYDLSPTYDWYHFPWTGQAFSNVTVKAVFATLDTVLTNISSAADYHFPAGSSAVSSLTSAYPPWDTGLSPVVPDNPDALFDGKGSWWISSGMHTSCVWTLQSSEFFKTNNYTETFYNKGVTTNKHNDIKRMAEALKYTMVVRYPADVLQHTNSYAVRHEYVYSSTNAEAPSSVSLPEFAADCDFMEHTATTSRAPSFACSTDAYKRLHVAGHLAGGTAVYSDAVVIREPCDTDVPVADVTFTGDGGLGFVGGPEGEGWQSGYTEIRNAVLDYPSVYALTNGYVKCVRVYAVVHREETDPIRPHRSGTWDFLEDKGTFEISCEDPYRSATYPHDEYNLVTVTALVDGTLPTEHMGDNTMQLTAGRSGEVLNPLVPCPLDLPAGYPANTDGSASIISMDISKVKANLVFKADNPDSPEDLMFDIVGPSPYSPSDLSYQTSGFDYTGVQELRGETGAFGYENYTVTTTFSDREYVTDETVTLLYFIVVVDWNWEHYGDIPFVPGALNPAPVWRDE